MRRPTSLLQSTVSSHGHARSPRHPDSPVHRLVFTALLALVSVLSIIAASPGAVLAGQPSLSVATGHPLVLADQRSTSYLKVALTGQSLDSSAQRTGVNVAIVIDRSGSMSGQKIQQAREAAVLAVNRLSRNDIVSVVTYDHLVNVVVPATKLTDPSSVINAIRQIQTGGNTALFAGVAKGADEVRKFRDAGWVNRVVLISDGLANVGPSSPSTLGELGASLIREGISVTTIGLGGGYNEDLMSQLARQSDGNHYYAERASDLRTVFSHEFGDLTSVVAKDLRIQIDCGEGVRPVRVLGRDAWITGSRVTAKLSQLYAAQEKYVMLEIELPARSVGQSIDVASVTVDYLDLASRDRQQLVARRSVRTTYSTTDVSRESDARVMEDATLLVATEQNKLAVTLRDQGKMKEAKRILLDNVSSLKDAAVRYKSKKLKDYGARNTDDADNLAGPQWKSQRKKMRRYEHMNEMQQMH